MEWYWPALALGIAAPWLLMPGQLLLAFRERGLLMGLSVWIGMAILPLILSMGLFYFVFR